MEKISLIVNFLPVATTLSRSRPAVSHCLLSAGSVARPGAGDVATEGRHQGRGDRQRRDVGGDQLVVARPPVPGLPPRRRVRGGVSAHRTE